MLSPRLFQMHTPLISACPLLFGLLFVLGCGSANSPSQANNGKLRVCCTTGQVADMVRAIGTDALDITVLIGPGVDPHSFRASSGDAERLDAAEVVFYNGLHLEGRLTDVLEKLNSKKPTLGLGDELLAKYPDQIRQGAEFGGAADPHIWFDAKLWSQAIPAVVETLSKLRPESKAQFEKNAEAYKAKLLEVDEFCRAQIATIPKESRVMVTAHDAFGYFGRAYDIEVHGLQGISTVDEANVSATNSLIKMLVDRQIKAIFVESSVSPERLKHVIESSEKMGHKVTIGGVLYSDALGETGTEAETYLGMMRANIQTIVSALK